MQKQSICEDDDTDDNGIDEDMGLDRLLVEYDIEGQDGDEGLE